MSGATGGLFYKVDHPLLAHKIKLMRDEGCSTNKFRQLMNEISLIMAVETTRDIPADGPKKPAIVVIVRAGLGMSNAFLELMPLAPVGHIGLHRQVDPNKNENKLIQYVIVLPDVEHRYCLILDPVIGTGNVASRAISILKKEGVTGECIRYVTIVAAPQGLIRVQQEHNDVKIYFADMADKLDKYLNVVPGWGDASNRIHGIIDPAIRSYK